MFNLREFLGLSYYTSQIDKFIAKFRKDRHQLSKSQRAEIEKYQAIHKQRDGEPTQHTAATNHQKLWEQF